MRDLGTDAGARATARRHVAHSLAVVMALIGILTLGSASAASAATSLKWSAADPASQNGAYLPTYPKVTPAQKACPTPSGSAGRATSPLADAVAFASPATSSNFDAVSSLTPKDLALGQIVPFEMVVTASTTPTGALTFTPSFLTKTTSGDDFGFDPAYGILCAFVDTGDAGTTDPGADAKVTSFTSLTDLAGTSNENIRGDITVSGLQAGDRVIVEIWVVLKSTLPAGVGGNVQTSLLGAYEGTPANTVNTGAQTVPLLQVGKFLTVAADVSVTKTDSPDPATQGGPLSYSVTVNNTSVDTVANGVVVTDRLDAGTTLVSATGATCTATAGVVTCDVGFLVPGETRTITLVTTVTPTATATNDPSTNPEAGFAGTTCPVSGADLCNRVSVTATTADPTPANNAYVQPTNVLASATPMPAISLAKTVAETSYAGTGTVLHYTLVATNVGTTSLSGVTISDPLLGTLSCDKTVPATLASGATLTCTGTHVSTQADVDAGTLTNLATTSGTSGGVTVTDNDQATVPGTAPSALSVTKTADRSTFTTAGQLITYTLKATNTGATTLTNATISDPLLGTLSCTPAAPATLAPGASLTCTGSYTTLTADLTAGEVDNTASATAIKPGGGMVGDTASVAVPASGLDLVKTATETSFAAAGTTLHYTLVATNTGQTTLSGVTISDPLAGSLACSPAAPATLAPGAKLTCTGTYVTTQADADAGGRANTATSSGTSGGTTVTDTDTVTVPGTAASALTLTKVANRTSFSAAGVLITYTLTAKNTGATTLTAATISDAMLPSLSCTPSAPASLAPNATLTCTGTYTTTSGDVAAGRVDNSATAAATKPGGGSIDKTASATVPASGLQLVKTATESSFSAAGTTLHYTLVATNTGQTTLGGVTITDPLVGALSCDKATPATLTAGAKLTCTGTYVTTQADADASTRTNTASTSGSFDGLTVTDTDTATVPGSVASALTLTKTANRTSFSAAGVPLTYTLTAKNTGGTTLTAAAISDPKLGALSCTPTAPVTLAPDATLTCTGTYTTTAADVTANGVDNTASVTAKKPGGDPLTKTASATVPYRRVAISLDKTADSPFFTAAGTELTYTLVTTNTGQTALTGVSISDPKLGALNCTPAAPATLAPGATLTCTGSYTTTAADVASGTVANTATTTGTGPDVGEVSDSDSADVTYREPGVRSDLHLTKTASAAKVEAGETFTYTLSVRNDGPDVADRVTVVDPIAHELTFVSAGPGCTFAAGAVTCDLGSIAPGQTVTRTITVTVSAAYDVGTPSTAHDLLITRAESAHGIPGGQTADLSLACPSGSVMVDGSAQIESVDQGTGSIALVRVLRAESDPADPSAYRFRVHNGTTGQAQVHLFGVCVGRTTTDGDGHAHTLAFSDVLQGSAAESAGRHDRTLTCPSGTAAVAPGYRFSGTAGDLVRSEASPDGRSWSFGYVLDDAGTVDLSVRCLGTRTSTDDGHFEVLQLTHVHRMVTVAPSDLGSSQPASKERVTCPDGSKGIVGTYDLPDGVRLLGSSPQPINRDFALLNTTGAPVEVHLDLLCLGIRIGDFGQAGTLVNRAWAFSDQIDLDNGDDIAVATVQVVPAGSLRPAAPAARTTPAAPSGSGSAPTQTAVSSTLSSGRATVAAAAVTVKRSTATIRVACAKGGPACVGTLAVRSATGKRLGTARYTVRAGSATVVRVALRGAASVRRAVVTVAGRDGRTTRRTVLLKR